MGIRGRRARLNSPRIVMLPPYWETRNLVPVERVCRLLELAVLGSGTLANKVTIGVVCAAGLLLTGCGNSVSNALNDTLGLSKEVPDERVVRTHQTLAVPPDLQLRPACAW